MASGPLSGKIRAPRFALRQPAFLGMPFGQTENAVATKVLATEFGARGSSEQPNSLCMFLSFFRVLDVGHLYARGSSFLGDFGDGLVSGS